MVLAVLPVLGIIVSVILTGGGATGVLGWGPLLLLAVLVFMVPLTENRALLEAISTLATGIMAYAGLILSLQLSTSTDLRRESAAPAPNETSEIARFALDSGNDPGAVFLVMVVAAWLVAWIAARQIGRVRKMQEDEELELLREAQAEQVASLDRLAREVARLRTVPEAANKKSSLRVRWRVRGGLTVRHRSEMHALEEGGRPWSAPGDSRNEEAR